MSQMPEQYYVFLKLHEAFIRMCDVSIKTLEIIEKEKTNETLPELLNLKNQIDTFVVENLSLYQGETFIESVTGDKIVKQGKEEKIEIYIGDNAQISGSFVVARSIEDSFNILASSDIDKDLKASLMDLSVAVSKIMEYLPKDEADDVVEDLDTLIKQATREKPKRKWWSVSVDGLTKAAEKVGVVGVPILNILDKIVLILKDVSV